MPEKYNKIWELNLKSSHKLTLLALFFHSSNKEFIKMSHKDLSKHTNLSISHTSKNIRDLIKMGMIDVKRTYYDDGGCDSNLYTFKF